MPVTTTITFSPTAGPPDEPFSRLLIIPSHEAFMLLFLLAALCATVVPHVVLLCDIRYRFALTEASPGDSSSFGLTPGFNVSSQQLPTHPRSHPWGVTTHSVKFQEGTAPRPGCGFLWSGFLIPIVCCRSEIHNSLDLGWVLPFSVLFREAQGGVFIWKGSTKVHPTLEPVSSWLDACKASYFLSSVWLSHPKAFTGLLISTGLCHNNIQTLG